MVIEHLERAWEAYKNNFWPVVGGYLMIMAAAGLIAGVGLVMLVFPVVLAAYAPSTTSTALTVPLIIFGLIFMVVGILLGAILGGGYISLTRDALKKKAKIGVIFDTARARWRSILGATILMTLIKLLFLSPAIILIIISVLQSSTMLMIIGLLFVIPGFLLSILLDLTVYAVVLDGLKAVDGLKKGFRVVKNNYLQVLALSLILAAIGVAVSLLNIPFAVVGTIVAAVFVPPFSVLVWTSFYLSKKK